MRRAWALSLALFLALLNGCISDDPDKPVARHDAQKPLSGPPGDDIVILEIALLECPVNDAYINGSLWDLVDETANPDRKTVLHDNGYRMGLIGPVLPDRLIDLTTSERNASNIRPRCLVAGTPTPVPVGPAWTHCTFKLERDELPTKVKLDKAQCVLEIVAARAADGKVALGFTPLVQHGEVLKQTRPVQDPSNVNRWELQVNQAVERYDWLRWELTVAPNEYLVTGTQMDRAGTLGYRSFLYTETTSPVQRLLLARVVRAPQPETPAVVEEHGKSPLPLALQAVWTSVRGKGP